MNGQTRPLRGPWPHTREPWASASLPVVRSGRPRCWGVCCLCVNECVCVCDCFQICPVLNSWPPPRLGNHIRRRSSMASTPHPGSLPGLPVSGHRASWEILLSESKDVLTGCWLLFWLFWWLWLCVCVYVCVCVCVCSVTLHGTSHPVPGPSVPSTIPNTPWEH